MLDANRKIVKYKPVESKRLFTFQTYYNDIDWKDFHDVLGAFGEQLEYWYILPAMELKKAILDSQ